MFPLGSATLSRNSAEYPPYLRLLSLFWPAALASALLAAPAWRELTPSFKRSLLEPASFTEMAAIKERKNRNRNRNVAR